MKNAFRIFWANVCHSFHAFRHGLAKHRMEMLSIKPAGALLPRTAQIECECGKSFYVNQPLLNLLEKKREEPAE